MQPAAERQTGVDCAERRVLCLPAVSPVAQEANGGHGYVADSGRRGDQPDAHDGHLAGQHRVRELHPHVQIAESGKDRYTT